MFAGSAHKWYHHLLEQIAVDMVNGTTDVLGPVLWQEGNLGEKTSKRLSNRSPVNVCLLLLPLSLNLLTEDALGPLHPWDLIKSSHAEAESFTYIFHCVQGCVGTSPPYLNSFSATASGETSIFVFRNACDLVLKTIPSFPLPDQSKANLGTLKLRN